MCPALHITGSFHCVLCCTDPCLNVVTANLWLKSIQPFYFNIPPCGCEPDGFVCQIHSPFPFPCCPAVPGKYLAWGNVNCKHLSRVGGPVLCLSATENKCVQGALLFVSVACDLLALCTVRPWMQRQNKAAFFLNSFYGCVAALLWLLLMLLSWNFFKCMSCFVIWTAEMI